MADFLTIAGPSEAKFTEKMSRFLAFAKPVSSVEEAKEWLKGVQKEYFDARHVCWAWIIGDAEYSNDNGEPSGTAGKPILGQIRSKGLRDVVVAVVRYFGGIKLGTPGLIAAYRESARLCLDEAEIIEKCDLTTLDFQFGYEAMNPVMQLVKNLNLTILDRDFNNLCHLRLEVPLADLPAIAPRFAAIPTVVIDHQ